MMDERKRFRAFAVVLIAVIAMAAVFGVGAVVADGDTWAIVTSIAILAVMAVVVAIVLRRRLEDMERGFPSEDERSAAMKMRTGHIAFWASVYFCFALGWMIDIFVDEGSTDFLAPEELVFVVAGVMCLIYVVTWGVMSIWKGRA